MEVETSDNLTLNLNVAAVELVYWVNATTPVAMMRSSREYILTEVSGTALAAAIDSLDPA